jgi:uncharacterized protein with NRDE domain
MCLILFSWQPDTPRRLVLLANRDEFHHREALQAGFWPDRTDILAGRDLTAGGTWLGLNRNGRLAAVTNFRQPGSALANARSRGELTTEFLSTECDSLGHARAVAAEADHFNGFSLLLFDGNQLVYLSNRHPGAPMVLGQGIYGLSNHLLDTPWPKVQRGKQQLASALTLESSLEELMPILLESRVADDHELPDTGVGLELERMLSAACIRGQNYGTRCCTAVEIRADRSARFIERTLVPAGLEPDTVKFNLRLSGAAPVFPTR